MAKGIGKMVNEKKMNLKKLAEKLINASFWINADRRKPGVVVQKLSKVMDLKDLRGEHFDHEWYAKLAAQSNNFDKDIEKRKKDLEKKFNRNKI